VGLEKATLDGASVVAEEDEHSQRLYDHCGDFFVLALQISSGNVELPSAEALMRRVLMMFEALKSKATQSGCIPQDIEDAQYALAAFLDEVIQYSNWPGKLEWSARPLQAVLFNESRAGVHFFSKLDEIRRRSPEATRVYYACLALGFQGEIRLFGGNPDDLLETLKRELFHGLPKSLSPHGPRPDDRRAKRRGLPLLPIATVALLLAIATVVTLYLLVSSQARDVLELLTKMGRQ
jgi:type VI secretion system protein ImpK